MKWDVKPHVSRNSGPRRYSYLTKLPLSYKLKAGVKLLNLTLSASMLVLLAGDVSSNPAPQYHRLVDVTRYRGLKIAHLNVRSLRNKLDLISFELVNKKLFDVLTFSETWLDESISDSEVKLDGYNSFICKVSSLT